MFDSDSETYLKALLNGGVGFGFDTALYKLVLNDISSTVVLTVDDLGNPTSTALVPKTGVDLAVYSWITAAVGINSNTSAAATLVNTYNSAITAIRGQPVSGLAISTASAAIGLALANGILQNSGRLPDIVGLGVADAGSAASGLFGGAFSPWAGTALFAFFKDAKAPNGAPFYKDWLLTGDTVTGTGPNFQVAHAEQAAPYTFKQYLGTYELISCLEAYQRVPKLTYASVYLAGNAAGSQASPSTADTQDFLLSYYGLVVGQVANLGLGAPFGPTIFAAPFYDAGTIAGETINVDPKDQVIVGGPGNDTVVVSTAPNSMSMQRSRVVDGGLGLNTLKYDISDPVTVGLLPVRWTPRLACLGQRLEIHRAEIADGRMASPRVVEALDVVEHIGAGLVAGAVDAVAYPLGFQR